MNLHFKMPIKCIHSFYVICTHSLCHFTARLEGLHVDCFILHFIHILLTFQEGGREGERDREAEGGRRREGEGGGGRERKRGGDGLNGNLPHPNLQQRFN